ncbi:MAG: glycosyltransferase family 2 protein [Proteobacteria bacterium]|nr:glycosyltransferase family 2 protein [Pseudomonadota bacterium]
MVDIIIVTHNAEEKLRACVTSLRKNTENSNYILTIVNNGSSDGTAKYLKTLKGNVQVITTKANKGFCYGANLGIESTNNDIVTLLDDDVEVTKDWLPTLLKKLRKKAVGIVTPKIIFPNGTIFSAGFFLKKLLSLGYGEIDFGQYNRVREFDAFPGPCWLIKRKVLQEIGKFDEKYFPCQYEDLDYCLRVRQAGYKIIYNGKVSVIHHNLFRSAKKQSKNLQYFLDKWKSLLNKLPFTDSAPENILMEKAFSILDRHQTNTDALKYLLKAKNIHKVFISPYYLGYAYKQANKPKKAIFEFNKCLESYDPEYFPFSKITNEINLLNKRI